MTEEQVQQELKKIFKKVAPEIEFDLINLNRPLRDQVEIDSMDFYKILVEINKATRVNVPDSVILELQNLKDLISFVAKKSHF